MGTSIIVSDLHLGTCVSRTDLLADLLATDFDEIILNGDTVDSLNFKRFRPCDLQILRRFRSIAREGRLVLIRGNHDGRTAHEPENEAMHVLADLLGTQLREEYQVKVGGRPYLVLHGDQFDNSINLTWIGDVADCCYRRIQCVSKRTALWLKGRVKHLGGIVRTVRERAVRRAQSEGYAGVITGHTHYWSDEQVEGIHYLNTGCWVDWPCSFVCVRDGTARVEHWPGGAWPAPRIAATRPEDLQPAWQPYSRVPASERAAASA